MTVTQEMVDNKPTAHYKCPSCGAFRIAAMMVWSGTVRRYVCRQCEPEGTPTLGDVQVWRGPAR